MGSVAFRFAVGRLMPSVVSGLLLAFAWVVPALAAPPVENTSCIWDVAPSGNICQANDITLSSPVVTVLDGCDFPGDTALLQVMVDVTGTAQTRYDIGVWLSVDGDPNGDGSKTGICSVLTIPNTILDTDGDSVNIDTDNCGDVANTGNAADISQADMGTVTLLCDDADGDGQLDVPLIISWDNTNSTVCNVSTDAKPNTTSKCRADTSFSLPVPIPARVIVNKDVVPNGAQTFNFTLSGPVPGGWGGDWDGSELFNLGDGDSFDSGTISGGLPAGNNYSVVETPVGGYATQASCSSDLDGDNTDPADLDLRAGETVTCNFTNTVSTATLTVVKNTQGGNGAFNFNTTGFPGASDFDGGDDAFTLDTGVINTASLTDVITLNDLDNGDDFTIAEVVPAGWSLASATCSNGDAPGALNLEPGDNVTCTFANNRLASVTVVKNTVGGNGSFDFTTTVPTLGVAGAFSITTVGNTGAVSALNTVPAGNYSINETPQAGWDLTSATCSDGSNPTTLALAHGESVTCTFTNTQRGTIRVTKQTLPDGSPQSFTFTGNVAGAATDGQTLTTTNLVPGNYTSTETLPAGWMLTSIVCSDANSSGNTGTATASFNLQAGEDVTCTFTNTQDGTIEVVKSLAATGPANETFAFTSNFNGMFQLTGHLDSTGPIGVVPGSGYMVAEVDPSANGWVNTGASCSDGSAVNNVNVSPGEAVVCTFTNVPLGSATIIKNTIGGDGTFDFIGDTPFNGLQLTTVGGTDSQDFTFQLSEGDYDVTESPVPAGWSLTNLGCVEDGDQDSTVLNPTATLDVENDETVTCTFTNTADGTLVIRKETVPDGAGGSFNFTGDVAGSIGDGEQLSESGLPGVYTSTETVPAGWALTDIACTGQVESTVMIGGDGDFDANDTGVSVNVAAGETVTCTFTNTQLGSITIEKESVGDTGQFAFNSNIDGNFVLDTSGANPDSEAHTGLLPGSYQVSEVVPSNWTLTGIACSGAETSTVTIGAAGGFDPGDTGVSLNLAAGEDLTCRFTNTADGRIRVEKQTDPDGSAQLFGFTGDITASISDGQFSDWVSVQPGNYSATETAVAGWSVTGITCDDGDSSGAGSTASFVVGAGEDVTCTFTNTIARGTITVIKQTDPDGSQETFDFTPSWGAPFTLADGQQQGSGALLPSSEAGAYSVAETGIPAGWTILSAVCSGAGNTPAAINLQPGEDVTCTFTNTLLRASIVVDKVTLPGGATQSFTFTTSYGGGFALADQDLPNDSGALVPSSEAGPYSVSETVPAGWELTSASCSNGDDPSSIDLGADTIVTCTFVNTQQARIEAQLVLNPPLSDTFNFSGNLAALLGHNGVIGKDVAPGAYSAGMNLAAIAAAGWSLGSITCDDIDSLGELAAALANFVADPGETVRCVFALEADAGLTLVKSVDGGDASPLDFDLTLTGVDGTHDAGVAYMSGATPPVMAGVQYTVSEAPDQIEDYLLSSMVCVDNADQASLGTTFTLQPGQNVTCTATNTLNEVIFDILTEVCIRDTPFVDYEVSTTGGEAPAVTITWIKNDGSNEVVEVINDAPPIGTLLWPGAAVDMDGNPIDWPGWDFVDGVWVEVDDGLRPTMILQFDINPTAQVVVSYPPATPACDANPPPPPPPPGEHIPVPVNNAWALALMTLMLLALGWYFRPVEVRSRH